MKANTKSAEAETHCPGSRGRSSPPRWGSASLLRRPPAAQLRLRSTTAYPLQYRDAFLHLGHGSRQTALHHWGACCCDCEIFLNAYLPAYALWTEEPVVRGPVRKLDASRVGRLTHAAVCRRPAGDCHTVQKLGARPPLTLRRVSPDAGRSRRARHGPPVDPTPAEAQSADVGQCRPDAVHLRLFDVAACLQQLARIRRRTAVGDKSCEGDLEVRQRACELQRLRHRHPLRSEDEEEPGARTVRHDCAQVLEFGPCGGSVCAAALHSAAVAGSSPDVPAMLRIADAYRSERSRFFSSDSVHVVS